MVEFLRIELRSHASEACSFPLAENSKLVEVFRNARNSNASKALIITFILHFDMKLMNI